MIYGGLAVPNTPKNEKTEDLLHRKAREDRAVELVTQLCRREGADKVLPLIERWIRKRRSRAARFAAQEPGSGRQSPR